MSYTGFFLDTPYKVVDGNIVYASDLNNPLAALTTGFSNLVDAVQTGATIAAGVDVGTANAYQISLVAAPASYVDGLMVWFKPASTNTGAATLNVNSLGAKPVRSSVRSALVGGELLSGFWFQLKYSLSHDVFLMVSYHGGTDISALKAVSGGEGITVTSNDDTVFIEVTDGGITADKLDDDAVTTDKIADAAVTGDKISNAANIVRDTITGGDIVRKDDTHVTISPTSCWDSTLTVFLDLSSATDVELITGANALSELFVVRLLNGTVTAKSYATEAAAAADTATTNAYRWVGEWLNTGAGSFAVQGIQVGAYFHRGKASECVLSSSVTTAFATVDHSAQLNTARVELIEYGVRDASETDSRMIATDNGTDSAFSVGASAADLTTTNESSWGYTAREKSGLKPFNSARKFKATAGTIDLLVQQVKWRR